MTGSDFGSKVLSGAGTLPEEWEQHLRDVHARLPGMTSAAFSRYVTQEGRTSYQVLAGRLGEAARVIDRPVDLLDLACGDGYFIDVCLHELGGEIGAVTGVDMSEAELDLARQRLDDGKVRLLSGVAQDLPLVTGSIDVAVCHLAFMLMLPVEPVVKELARVLRPRGVFSAVVGSTAAPARSTEGNGLEEARALWAEIGATLQAFWKAEYPHLETDGRVGDARAMTEAGWAELFRAEGGWSGEIELEEFELLVRESAEAIWSLFSDSYLVELLDAGMREKLRDRVTAVVAEHEDARGTAAMTFPLRRLSIQRGYDRVD